MYFPLLVLKGIYHCWIVFFPQGPQSNLLVLRMKPGIPLKEPKETTRDVYKGHSICHSLSCTEQVHESFDVSSNQRQPLLIKVTPGDFARPAVQVGVSVWRVPFLCCFKGEPKETQPNILESPLRHTKSGFRMRPLLAGAQKGVSFQVLGMY